MRKYVLMLTAIVIAIPLAISWDIYRWQTFKEVTKSDVSYLKWKFVIESGKGGSKK